MQWTLTCILLASTSLISASDDGTRSKRDLSFFKTHLLSKIFGSYANDSTPLPPKQENYRLFKIPGHDNILVKAVPKVPAVLETDRPPLNVLEITETETEPVHPSIAIVSKYLGTEKLNDTLFALKGVKDLLQSGVLTAEREEIDRAALIKHLLPSVIVESSNIVVDDTRRPVMVYPSRGEAIIKRYPVQVPRYPNLPVPSKYSYKQVNNAGVMTYTANDNQNVMVTEMKRPVPLPPPISYRIQDIFLTYRMPTSPVVKYPSPVPVFNIPKVPYQTVKVKPPYIPSGYSYNQVHNDGSKTTYSGSGHVEDTIVVTEGRKPASVVVAEVESHPRPIPVFNLSKVQVPSQPVKFSSHGSGYSYNHVHNDGSVTTYSGSGHVMEHGADKQAVVRTEPGRPTVVVSDLQGPPAPFPLYDVPSSGGYSYNHVHNDGSLTTYSGSGHVMEHGPVKPAFVITEPGRPTFVVSDIEGPPVPFPVFNEAMVKLPPKSGYSYNHVHNDGTVTTYSGSGHVLESEGEKSAMVITQPGRPTVVVADVEGPPAPLPVFNIPKVTVSSAPGYSYNHVRNDGTVTTYSGSGHVLESEGEKSAMVITKPGRPTVVVSDVEGPPAPFPVFNVPKQTVSSAPGYSYKQVSNDGTVTTYSGSGHVLETEEEKPAMVITKPGRPTVVVSDEGGPAAPFPVFNVPKQTESSAPGYSYNHVRNDGTVTTYSGSGHVLEKEGQKPAMVITKSGRPTVVVSDVEGPPAPLPVFNIPKVTVFSAPGYFYNHVRNDGIVTTYSGSGHVQETEGQKPAMVITKPGRPTVVVSDVEGPPAPSPVFNVPKQTVSSAPGYSYNHVRNDGTITTYSGSGHVLESTGEKSAMVITKPGRPTVVVPDMDGPPAPIPVFNAPQMTVLSGPGYSYNHVPDDGTITAYGSGHMKEHQGPSRVVVTETRQPMPLPTFLANRIENAAATAMASRSPTGSNRRPMLVTHEESVKVEERPEFVYHVGQNPHQEPGHPNNKDQIKDQTHNNEQYDLNTNFSSGFSYQTVHQDGSVTSHANSVESAGAHVIHDRPMLYPTGPAAPSVNIGKEHFIQKVECKDPTHLHQEANDKKHSHAVEVNTNSNSSFSYTMVGKGAASNTYTGSGHVEHQFENAHIPTSAIVNPPVLVTQTDNNNPQTVRLTPILSQYMYKQINHHRPNELTVVNVGNGPQVNGQVDVKVGSSLNGMSVLENIKEVSEIPKDYMFVPPSLNEQYGILTKEPVKGEPNSSKKANETLSTSPKSPSGVSTSTKVSHSFKQKRVRHRVRTSTSVSSSRVMTSAPITTTPSVSSSTMATSSEGSLSAHPIVVLPEENVFSFKQDRADGSSITAVGNKENQVSVVEEPKTSPSRGDIPESSY